MAKDKRRMAKVRASKIARKAVRKKNAAQHPNGGGPFARMGCTRDELRRSPVHAAYVSDVIFQEGMGHVIIARVLPDGRIAAGFFLIDAYCLGVKNAFLGVKSLNEFEDVIATKFAVNDLKPAAPAFARKLVEDAIDYARNLGFEPHPDFRTASVILGDIDPTTCDRTFTFGKDGKPFYISGPHDSETRIRGIIARLRNRCGPDGAHFLVRVEDAEKADVLGLEGDIIRTEEV